MNTAGAAQPHPTAVYVERMARAREQMEAKGIDVMLLSLGLDLPYITGYHAMPLERLTMLVVPREGEVRLVIPRMEAARVVPQPGVFQVHPWGETENPVEIVARLAKASSPAETVAMGDQTWARFLIELLPLLPEASYSRADVVTSMRMTKDAAEIAALRAAGAAVDRIAAQLQAGEIPLVGRTEAAVSADLSERIIAEGHQVVNFAIVAAGPNAASPHHSASERVIAKDEILLCDFGGTMNGYCSDITRCVYLGTPPAEVADAYAALHEAQRAAALAGTVGTSCQDVDRTARRIIAEAGYGDYFFHRTGHGIGLEGHEDPYIVEGNALPLAAGHAYSVEPGIYMEGKWGMRLEDIIVATEDGPLPMNVANHDLVSLDG
jgi:Xaa-Pro aminopeptidase